MSSSTRTVAFSAHNVTFEVGAAKILRGVSLDVAYGEVVALVGPNGAGKSTLLSLLSGEREPSSGAVTLDGRALSEWKTRELAQARAVLLQSNSVAFSFTTEQVVEMGRAPWIGTPQSDSDEQLIAAAIERADVAHLNGRAFPSLSGGEKARTSLARVLAQDTRVVLLDEPTAALDLRHQEDVLRCARDLARDGRAVVVVLHDLSLASAYADLIAIMHRGEINAYGPPAEVVTAERIEEVYDTPVRILADPDTGKPIVLPIR